MIRKPRTILALFTALNLLNYLDRFVLSAVLGKVQDELALSNFMAGLLATVFLASYFVTAPAFGRLGDRLARKWLIAIGIVVWSAATIGSGLATGAVALFVSRAIVGVGEASYATLAPTIIDDVTPSARKGRALAVFYLATPVGTALGYIVGGLVEKHAGWRTAFFVAGGPGLLLAMITLLVKEPERVIAEEKADVRRDLGRLVRTPLYRQGVLGYCAYTAAIGAYAYWAPTFLYRRYGIAQSAASTKFGMIVVVAGALATAIGGFWADRVQKRVESQMPGSSEAERDPEVVRGQLGICAKGSLLGTGLAAACFFSTSANMFFAFAFFSILALFMSTSPINAVILRSAPQELRASAMALAIFAIHMFGDLWSPSFVGLLADHLPMQLAMMPLPIAIALSAWLWWPKPAPATATATNASAKASAGVDAA
ncbi:Permease of the major facilitator superfamily [Labilithrix luteola]|uniref:Permease of the major facilitator superfamily n=1 Tax=Labilithrix luteola TaxID=1391654 RepID=A0A0K1Q8I0_9BACT|nr:MFS transporter [Labilithrix luteola]AKV02116.1 Permease of the major facilitator superfamily [Labilithrix luteola]